MSFVPEYPAAGHGGLQQLTKVTQLLSERASGRDSSHFGIELQAAPGREHALLVTEVSSLDRDVPAYNESRGHRTGRLHKVIRPGDLIIDINDEQDMGKMLWEIRSRTRVVVTVEHNFAVRVSRPKDRPYIYHV